MEKLKPGFLTSEGMAFFSQLLFNIFLMSGIARPEDADTWTYGISMVISGIVTAGMGIAYISGRNELKKQQFSAKDENPLLK